jgi:hypothetical protein
VDCQTVDSSIGAGDYCSILQKIEGYNFAPLAQKTVTLSFWVKATKTGIYSVALRNVSGNIVCVKEFSIISSNAWEFKTITFPASPSTGTWDYANGIGVWVQFTLAAGSNFQGTAESWQSANHFATTNQVNACDSASNNFLITGVQLEEGDVATPFENRTFADELRLCERYYEKSYDLSQVAGSATTLGMLQDRAAGTSLNINVPFRTTKRTAPSVTFYNPVTGTTGEARNYSQGVNVAFTAFNINDKSFLTDRNDLTDNNQYAWHYVAISEL